MKCKICSREAGEKGYCELHTKAYEIVARKYKLWKKALGLSWKEYLSELAKNPLTGEWAKDVAKYLVKDEEKQNVTNC